MAIGPDLLTELAMHLWFSEQSISWDDLTVPMQIDKLSGTNQDDLLYMLATKAPILKLAEERQNRILDVVNCEVIDMKEKVNVSNYSRDEQKKQQV